MNVTFGNATLAALCNSHYGLVERWGSNQARLIGRRLLDLTAIDAGHLERLPHVDVASDGDGATTLTFAGGIVIEGVITEVGQRSHTTGDEDQMVITRVTVLEDGR